MNFWHNLQIVTGTYADPLWVAISFLCMAGLLWRFLPAERRRIRLSFYFYAISWVVFVVLALLLPLLPADSTTLITLRCSGHFLEAVAFINLASTLLFAAVLRPLRLDPPKIVQDLFIGFAYVVFAIFLLAKNGLDVRGVVATSAVISAIIGFSLQDTLQNIMGGLALQAERTVRPGDWIRVDDIEGRVKEIRWRQTSLETREWDTVVIPNSMLAKAKIVLLGRRTDEPIQRRRWVYFNVDFRTPPAEVIQAVEAALNGDAIPNVAMRPAPHCIVVEFKDSYCSYAARYWLTDLNLPDPTDSLVRTRIFSALKRENIALSVPAQAIFLTQDDKSHQERKRQRELQRRVDALRKISLFKTLTDAELTTLASSIRNAPFVAGEAMARQNAVAHSLYIIVKGTASVHVDIGGVAHEVATLRDGDFFGEMGLLTGAPRSATVLAMTDVECYRLGIAGFEEILHSRPEIAEHISHTLAQRRTELDHIQAEATHAAQRGRVDDAAGSMLHRIRSFFGLGRNGGGETSAPFGDL